MGWLNIVGVLALRDALLVWFSAEVFLGLWLDARMRAEPPDAEAPAGNVN